MHRPKTEDYSPYYERYISLVTGDNIIEILEKQFLEIDSVLKNIPEEKGLYTYAEKKWTVKELIGHIIDTERVFAYRAMCFARGERKSLPSFEQDEYVRGGYFNGRNLGDLITEFRRLRESNITMFKYFNEDILNRSGLVEANKINVRAILFIIAGHAQHHVNILKEKYL